MPAIITACVLGEPAMWSIISGRRVRAIAPAERRFWAYGNKKLRTSSRAPAAPSAVRRPACHLRRQGRRYSYGSYPEIDDLFRQQASELDTQRRETILHKMQQLVHDKAIYAPIWQLAFMNAFGPRVGESGFGLIPAFAYTGPYEDMTIKGG